MTQKKRLQILNKRKLILESNSTAFNGNTRARNDYLAFLQNLNVSLTDYQVDLCIGLLLSDATLDKNSTGYRLKMQQSINHLPWVEHIKDCLLEYTASDDPFKLPTHKIRKMIEFQTLTCNELMPIGVHFYKNGNNKKLVLESIKPFITPVSLAYWFGGDGGKRDRDGKGIELHTQGFTKDECNILASAINENLGLQANVARDYFKNGIERYTIDLSGTSYDSFIEIVGPYIHNSMWYKIPPPRKENSRHGNMTEDPFNKLVGSKLIDDFVSNYVRPTYLNKEKC